MKLRWPPFPHLVYISYKSIETGSTPYQIKYIKNHDPIIFAACLCDFVCIVLIILEFLYIENFGILRIFVHENFGILRISVY